MTIKPALCLSFFVLVVFSGCKHEVPEPTVVPGETGGTGGTGETDPPCDPAVVYFEQQIQPLIRSSCAVPNCHDSFQGEPEFAMTSYELLLNNPEEDNLVVPGNPGESDIIDVILDGEMPPSGNDPLTQEQVNLLISWINQGAQNNSCEDLYCDTTMVTFSGTVLPLIENRCQGCHSGSTPQGEIRLTSYSAISNLALDGTLYGAVNHENGYVNMPFNGDQLPQCNIDQIRIWIEAGAPNN